MGDDFLKTTDALIHGHPLRRCPAVICLAAVLSLSPAAASKRSLGARGPTSAPARIDAVRVTSHGKATTLRVRVSHPCRVVRTLLHQPERLVLDFSPARWDGPRVVRGAGGVRAVRIAQHGGRKVRLVVDTGPRPMGWTGHVSGAEWVGEGHVHGSHLRPPNGAVEATAALHPLRGLVIGIDPGHGGGDPGAVAPSGLTEKEANLKIALRLRRLVNREGARTLMTRSDDRRLPVASRIAFVSSAGADLIISLHCDALDGSRHYTGVTSYYHGGSRRSQALAEALQEYLAAATGLPDRGARPDTTCHHSGFYVLRNATCPAVLVETGYLTSANTAARLRESGFRDRRARGIAAGLRHYLNAAPVRTARR